MLVQQLQQRGSATATTTPRSGESHLSRNATSNTANTTTSSASASVAASTNNNADAANVTNNPSIAHASRKQATSQGAGTKGTKNFGKGIYSMLDLIEMILPTGNEFWELVEDSYDKQFIGMNCNATPMKKILTCK